MKRAVMLLGAVVCALCQAGPIVEYHLKGGRVVVGERVAQLVGPVPLC